MSETEAMATEPKLLDFHVYRRAIFNTPADKRYCVASVWQGRMGSSQCSRKPALQYGGHGWCKQHYPPNGHARKQQREAEWRAESAVKMKKWADADAKAKLQAAALVALRQIAAGHNDPRGLALEVLGEVATRDGHEA